MSEQIKKIQISNGEQALVDKSDFDILNKYKWSIARGYAMRFDSKRKSVYMHKEILSKSNTKTDHINGNKLDNRRSNLRACTSSQNQMNQKKRKGTSKYKGVYWSKAHEKWRARITYMYKGVHIGLFEKEHHAAMAYDIAAKNLFGSFAKLNF